MFRFRLTLLLFSLIYASSFAQNYRYNIDLIHVPDDKIRVECITPAVAGDSVKFHLPKIVPGTYDVYNFGRFVSEFSAYDAAGNALPVSRPDSNTWVIAAKSGLHRIAYHVEDTWDMAEEKGKFVFEPAGSNFEEGKNFVLNLHAVCGYIDGKKDTPFEIRFRHPAEFFGSSALQPVRESDTVSVFHTPGFFELADNPVMFCKPDTAWVLVGDSKVFFSVYSPSGEVSAAYVAREVKEILLAQEKYLGGKLPVDHYAFVIYLFEGLFGGSGSYGALEHNHCSLYYLPEYSQDYLTEILRDFCAHEFFHIVTPLSLHSKEIHNFDFIRPEMSKHLWLYEGVTEYFAGHVQVSYGIITLEEYLSGLQEKLMNSEMYLDNLAFTELSEGCLEKYNDQYGNVYQKGALIGLCLDLILRRESKGAMGLRNLTDKLMAEYGPARPFDDDQLFADIERLSFPAAGEFLRKHVEGNAPLPLADLLKEVGIFYSKEFEYEDWTLGGIGISIEEDGSIAVDDVSEMDDFGKKMGYEEGDILSKFNGQKINADNAEILIVGLFSTADVGDMLEIEVLRPKKGKPGKKKGKPVLLRAPMQKVPRSEYQVIVADPDATAEQLSLREKWLIEE